MEVGVRKGARSKGTHTHTHTHPSTHTHTHTHTPTHPHTHTHTHTHPTAKRAARAAEQLEARRAGGDRVHALSARRSRPHRCRYRGLSSDLPPLSFSVLRPPPRMSRVPGSGRAARGERSTQRRPLHPVIETSLVRVDPD